MKMKDVLYTTLHDFRTLWKTSHDNWIFPLTNRIVGLCFLLSLAVIIWKWNILPPLIPLVRSRPWGEDRLVSPYYLFVIPASSILWHTTNIIVSFWLTREHRIFTQTLYLSSMMISLLAAVTTVAVIFLTI